jgi:[ribosomal protein S5]-alanine N-acetyltransferase
MLTTKRLYLRELLPDDIAAIHALHSLPETDEFNTLGIPENIKATAKLLTEWLTLQNNTPRESYIFCLELKATKQFIGLMALNLGKANYKSGEVWYKLHVDYWNNSYATEALLELLKFGFTTLTLHRIEAGCAVDNIGSIKVLKKVGMTLEGRKRKRLPIRGEWVDNYFYAILEEDYFAV